MKDEMEAKPQEGPAVAEDEDRHGRARRRTTPILLILEIYYVLAILLGLAGFMYASRDSIVYNADTLSAGIEIAIYGVAVWLIAKRMKAARWYLVAACVVEIVMAIVSLATGAWSVQTTVLNILLNLCLIAYLTLSRHLGQILCNDYNDESKRDITMPTMREARYWRNLIAYYCIFSVIGHWMEAGFCWLVSLGVVQGSVDFSNTELFRDWFYPFAIEGIGFVMCVLVLYPLKNLYMRKVKVPFLPLVLSFLTNAFVCSLIEFVMGLILNSDYGLWDYRPLPFNFMGQICLQNAIGFGIVSTIIVWVIYPFIERLADRLSRMAGNILAGIIVGFYAVLQSLYIITLTLPS